MVCQILNRGWTAKGRAGKGWAAKDWAANGDDSDKKN